MNEVAQDGVAEAVAQVEPAGDGLIDRSQPDWYKDAIIYEVHVKAFQDHSGDGIGDFAGLMDRLDHIQDLGATAIWLLPFYPSPLRDDGYDIADYRAINPAYGDMDDFRRFVDEAHRRGIRVITELVINHTSDQHPWFQRARQAPEGSPERDFYVWSDSDERYAGTRIIFLDTETSNWTWDPVAKAYFWHRFYSHQPDLNFDNPQVVEEVIEVLHYWLEMGVDGLRLDAVPYLREREGTNNENLPETHEILKRIRAEVDARYTDRMLLAEANQWPEDTRPYFGDGDESHMAFHFPLMPRMYMALAQEDRHPITDIIRQTPDIPESCQWAIFLRNHDELTLEMVTDEERDYLWHVYAEDKGARINLGIRRRLTPLMENDRRKIELMNALLLSMPGTPVLYYGDEIGMGDNFYLGDRDGVRTPMQWSADRNGGFSRADPQRLYLPMLMDPIHGYQAINVEAQQRDPSSLLNWMRRMITVRKQHRAFGRGSFHFLYPSNRKVLAYVREFDGEQILCVANLSRTAQAVELDLSAYRGSVPVELTGRSAFPPVGELPYLLTLPAYGFFWFALAPEAELPSWHTPTPEPLPEFITLLASDGLDSALQGREARRLESEVLPEFLARQRWFGGKDARIGGVKLRPVGGLDGSDMLRLMITDVTVGDGESQAYFLPLQASWGSEHLQHGAPMLSYTLAKLRKGPMVGALVDAARSPDFARAVLRAIADDDQQPSGGGLHVEGSDALRALLEDPEATREVRPVTSEQSNVSMIISHGAILKIYRRLREGLQPELEVARFLTREAGFHNTPGLLGALELAGTGGDEPGMALAAAFELIENQGDAWAVIGEALERELEVRSLATGDGEDAPGESFGYPLDLGATIGRRTAELHMAFAVTTDNEDFRSEPISADDVAGWVARLREEAEAAFASLQRIGAQEKANADVAKLLEARDAVFGHIDQLGGMAPEGLKTRIHGDYHLGQLLVAKTDVVIIDFEGEPRASLAERRAKTSPMRDVAGMVRSFDYAAWAAADRLTAADGDHHARIIEIALAWRDQATKAFLEAYRETRGEGADVSGEDDLFALFLLQKALYEIGYEAANRPAWLSIPVRGVLDLLTARGVLS